MLLTLPFERPAIVEPAPSAAWFIGKQRVDFFRVTEAFTEVPVASVLAAPAHCSRCGCLAPAAARACISSDCPSRVAA